MRMLIPIFAFVLCVLLVLVSPAAISAGREALALWWQTILPTLLPFFACATIIEGSGMLQAIAAKTNKQSNRLGCSPYLVPILLLAFLSGYPSAPRLAGTLQASGQLDRQQADRLATICNLCSPMFLLGALTTGMLGAPQLFFPIAIGHYGSALLLGVATRRRKHHSGRDTVIITKIKGETIRENLGTLLPTSLFDGMVSMIKVGSAIVFFFVLTRVLEQIGVLGLLATPLDALFSCIGFGTQGGNLLSGILELTGGCYRIAQSGASLRVSATLASFLVSFGGLCVMVQSMSFLTFQKPLRYLSYKLCQGLVSACITYFMIPVCLPESIAVLSVAESPYLQNMLQGGAILLASSLGLSIACLMGIWAKRTQAKGAFCTKNMPRF